MRHLLAALLLALAALPARAQPSPGPEARPISIVVPFPPGGLADVMARLVGEALRERLGQPVVIDNRPGAGGIVGARLVAQAAPDGGTLLLGNTNLAVNPSLYKSLPYETLTAFAPIIQAVAVPNFILVHSATPYRSLADFLADARARPGALNFSSAGNGTFPHLAFVLFTLRAGIQATHVPYTGAAPALQALLAHQVEALSNDPPTSLPHIRSGALRALGITSAQRLPQAPEVPTLAEQGVTGFDAVGWQGFLTPGGTPAPIIARLHAAIQAAMTSPAMREKLEPQGVRIVAGSSAEFAAFLRADIERWREAVRASGATVE
jgi:tripartite-type tricarboxylate transporter receptor subunit TctC